MHIELDRRRFEFYPEVTASLRRIGEKIAEVPISYNLRSAAEEKNRHADGWLATWILILPASCRAVFGRERSRTYRQTNLL